MRVARALEPLVAQVALALALALAPLAAFAGAGGTPQTKAQQRCVNDLGKAAAKLAVARAGQDVACLEATGKGKLGALGFAELGPCLDGDPKGKVAKQALKLADTVERRCVAEPPAFGNPGADAAAAAAVAGPAGTGEDLLSLNPFATACGDEARCRCQSAIAGASNDLFAAKLSEFAGCAKSGLRGGKAPFESGIGTPEELARCLTDETVSGSVAADSKGRLAQRVAKLAKRAEKACSELEPLALFPGRCPGLAGVELAACLDARVSCRACLALNGVHGLDADCDAFDDGAPNGSCPGAVVAQETLTLSSEAEPAETPGTPGVVVTSSKLLAQFGGGDVDLNRATYTRYHFASPPVGPDGPVAQPDAILVLVPGFEGGAGGFQILAENLLPRALVDSGQVLEVWGFDRRSHQLEDTVGLDLAEAALDPQLALDWLFGAELGLALSPALAAGPNRRAEFYDTQADVPFFASWTPLVHSLDLDAVVEAARAAARDGNVFLGGHSAGTGFAARYAATDFDLAGAGPAEPGHEKLRGLVLLEGGGGSSSSATPPDEDALDLVEARFDGGLFGAVRDGEARCVDGATPCTPATEDVDCAAFENEQCVEPTTAYSVVAGLLGPRLLAAAEPIALQAASDPDTGQAILQVEQGGIPDNSAVAQVTDLNVLGVLPPSTAQGAIGLFVDDEGFAASVASFIAMSVGARGPDANGVGTWLDITESASFPPCPGTGCVTPDNGPAPSALPPETWGVERESIDFRRLVSTFYRGGTNFTDWYYPSSGLSVTQGLPGLDTSALSADPPAGRGRRDIDNVVVAGEVGVPVIGFGGSNGLTPVPASFRAFASSIGPCTAPSCDGATPRVVSESTPSDAFPTLGGVAGGYEVHISVGYSHVDPLAAEDGLGNEVLAPLAAFLARNSE